MRVLGLFPHPDDETYAAGAALAQCAAAGHDTRVVTATRGEAGRDRSGRSTNTSDLARRRSAELAAACAALGVSLHGFLDLPDGGLDRLPPGRLATRVAKVLDDLTPDVVVTLGADGVYGALDHLALTRSIVSACDNRPTPLVLGSAFPVGTFTTLRRKLHRAGIAVDVDLALGGHAADVALRIDVGDWREHKLAALRAHASQLRDGDPFSFLTPQIVATVLREEWFVPLPCTSST